MITTRARVAAVQGPICDHGLDGMRGAGLLASAIAQVAGAPLELLGAPALMQPGSWKEDLEAARPLIALGSAFVERCFTSHSVPIVCMSKCAASIGTLPMVARERPDATVVWLDAHGDFNTPATTTTGYLGGLPVAGACGLWETGLGAGLRPDHLIFVGARDLDTAEIALMRSAGLSMLSADDDGVDRLLSAIGDAPVYVHLDWDVIDAADGFPTSYSVAGGPTRAQLRRILGAIVAGREVCGVELAELEAPSDPIAAQQVIHDALEVIAPVLYAVNESRSAPPRPPQATPRRRRV